MEIKNIIIAFIVFIIISGVLGIMIGIVNILFYVKNDDTEEVIYKMLPGYNCGACGKAGCLALAKDILKNKEEVYKCKPIKKEDRDKILNYIDKL